MADIIDDLPPLSAIPNEPTDPAPVDARLNVRLLHPTEPPSDRDAEKALIGSALFYEEIADLVARSDPDLFYYPQHGEIVTAISVLRGHAQVIDPVSVRAEVHRRNPATNIDDTYLLELRNHAPTKAHAETHLRILQECKQLRDLQRAGYKIKDAAEKQDVGGALQAIEDVREVVFTDTGDTTWSLVDLNPVLDDDSVEVPTMLQRSDGQCLIYPGRTHAFNAESEAGKSWLALFLCKERIDAGEDVLYIDCEDSARGIVGRLKTLGLHRDNIAEQFHYIRPDDPFSAQASAIVQEIISQYHPSVCIIDGITELLVMNNWATNKNDDIAAMLNRVARPIERTGTAVVQLDHLTKNVETQGPYAIGGQHKRAGITGASYKLKVLRPFGRGRSGQVGITVTKDRPGGVRGATKGADIIGNFVVEATDGMRISLVAPMEPDASGFLPTVLMERASQALETTDGPLSKSQWHKFFSGKPASRSQAMDELIRLGYVRRFIEHGKTLHEVVKPYRHLELLPMLDDSEDF